METICTSTRRSVYSLVACLALALPSAHGRDRADAKYAPVGLIHPLSNRNVTDIALSFRWERQSYFAKKKRDRWSTYRYQIQVAGNSSFTDPVIDHIQKPPVNVEDPRDKKTFDHWTEVMYMPPKILAPGRWYWRVRVADKQGGPWSRTIRFTIHNDHRRRAPGRTVSPANPIFIFELYGQYGDMLNRWTDYFDFFPDDLKPYTAFAVSREDIGRPLKLDGLEGTFIEMMEPFKQHRIPVFLKTGGPDVDFQLYADLTEIEYLFQNNPSVLGVTTAENFWDYIESEDNVSVQTKQLLWQKRLLMLCGKYGKYLIFGEGNYIFPTWDRFFGKESPRNKEYEWMSPGFIREYRDYFIPCPKNNIVMGHHQADSAVLGAWLSDTTTHMGTWIEAWYWLSCGYTDLFSEQGEGNLDDGDFSTMPLNLWIQMQILGLAKGATVFNFQGESSTTEWGVYNPASDMFEEDDEIVAKQYTAFFDMHGHKTPALDRYVIPFMRAVIKHKLIPTKKEVLKEVKVAVDPGPIEDDKGNMLSYGRYAPMYLSTYGIRQYVDAGDMDDDQYIEVAPSGCRYEMIPNSGRYYFIPVLPYPAKDVGGSSVREVILSRLTNETTVRAVFDKAYPERSTGDAWVALVSNKVFIMNSHENKNVMQTYHIPLDRDGGIVSVSGTVGPHAYVIGKRGANDHALWLQANVDMKGKRYTDGRITDMTFQCKRKPQVRVSPAAALRRADWDATGKRLSIGLAHTSGAVELDLRIGQ